MSSNIPAKPPDIEKLDGVQPIGQNITQQSPQDGKFASLMNNPSETSPANLNAQAPTPMNLSSQSTQAASAPPSLQDVQKQMQSVSGTLGDIKNQLHTKGLKLKQSDKYLLRSQLSSANDNIRSAAVRTGVNVGPPVDLSSKNNPISKFLAMVSDGQSQLASASNEINNLDSSGQSVSAAKLLLVQAKLQKAQQELDFSSTLLGSATGMLKTIFNVQI